MTGWRLTSSIPDMMRSLSSCFEVTRMWRRTERANLEKKPSIRFSHEPCLYQILESVTRLRFPDHDESDSTWRTTEVRHVGSNTFAWGFQGVSATRLGEEDQRWPPGATASGSCGDL